MNPIVLIPARMGATRFPRKPLARFMDAGGKEQQPLVLQAWQAAQRAKLGPVWVATDSDEILRLVEKAGGEAVMTRESHPSGSDRIYEALRILDPAGIHDVIINLQGDVPYIAPEDLQAALDALRESGADIATLATPLRSLEERNNPSVVKVILQEFRVRSSEYSKPANMGLAKDFVRALLEDGRGQAYHHIGIYVYRRAVLEKFVHLPSSPREQERKLEQLRALDNGMSIAVAFIDHAPPGVDTPEDLVAVSARAVFDERGFIVDYR